MLPVSSSSPQISLTPLRSEWLLPPLWSLPGVALNPIRHHFFCSVLHAALLRRLSVVILLLYFSLLVLSIFPHGYIHFLLLLIFYLLLVKPSCLMLAPSVSPCSCSWARGLFPAQMVHRNSSTDSVAFCGPRSCLTMAGQWQTSTLHSLPINTCFCFQVMQSNMTWWTSINDPDLQFQQSSLYLLSMRFRKVPTTVYPEFN